MNTTVIRTVQGRTIMLQHDATSPSPQSLFRGVYPKFRSWRVSFHAVGAPI